MAKDYGFKLRACRPYRARTKGKAERFNRYLKEIFIIPLAAKLKQANLNLDVATANAYVGPWLYEIANQRIQEACEQLKLPHLAAEWSAIADHCAAQDNSFSDLL